MLIGHQRIWNFLTQSAAKDRLAHAYLFVGPSQIGKKTLALEFIKWLLCEKRSSQGLACGDCCSCVDIAKNQHPDVFILAPRQEEKKGVTKTFEIGIDEIKELQHRLSLFPYSAKYKVAVIEEAAFLSREAVNSFLKTLEEPSGRSLIILTTSSWQNVLPTIISRCQLIKFLPVSQKEMVVGLQKPGVAQARLEKIIKLSASRPGRAIDLLAEPEILQDQQTGVENFKKAVGADLAWRWSLAKELSRNSASAQETLSHWLLWLRDRLLQTSGCGNLLLNEPIKDSLKYPSEKVSNLIREIQKTQAVLNNSSFNSQLALEILMMKI